VTLRNANNEHAYECDIECVEYREVVETTTELASKLNPLVA
jgi:hypothetical protein